MKPLILEYSETPSGSDSDIDFSVIEYSKELNLSVLKGTNMPAVNYLTTDTVTLTKSGGEGSDNDSESHITKNLNMLLDTSTRTLAGGEGSSDNDQDRSNIKNLLDTQTLTERVETTDRDK